MAYSVKECFHTLQGEGGQTGRAAVFTRFTGCNLWTGREADRASAVCRFCDTDFIGTDGQNGGRFQTAEMLAAHIEARWTGGADHRLVVFTGGEPLLQLDEALTAAVHARGFQVAVETNGTQLVPTGVDWLCVSPKAGAPLRIRAGQEIKLVYPQPDLDPAQFAGMPFERFFLQPLDGEAVATNIRAAIGYCLRHPQWRLSLQTHKIVGID